MKRKTLVAWQTVGQVEFAIFAILAAFGLAIGLAGYSDEAGVDSAWYHVVREAVVVLALGLPGLAIDFFARRALRHCPPDDDVRRGFKSVIKSDD